LDDADAPWETVTLPDRLRGQPCIFRKVLVAACADGLISLIPLGSGSRLDSLPTYQWSERSNVDAETANLYSWDDSDVFLVLGGGTRLLRLSLGKQAGVGVWRKKGSFESKLPFHEPPVKVRDKTLVTDVSGTMSCLRLAANNMPLEWKLNLQRPVHAPPVELDGKIFVMLDDARLARIDIQDEPVTKPTWISNPLGGTIRGLPVLRGDVLLVADNRRKITGLRVADGAQVWKIDVPAGSGPTGVVSPFGKEGALVPLDDGTLTVVRIPTNPTGIGQVMP
jgi:outer membrane protein assembly factor BamB